jgi:hypothetical protein
VALIWLICCLLAAVGLVVLAEELLQLAQAAAAVEYDILLLFYCPQERLTQ